MSSRIFNQGVVLYLKGTASGTYLDKIGATRNIGTLAQTYTASDEFQIGASQDCSIWLQGTLAGALTVSVALLLKRSDGSGLTWKWASIRTERLDDGQVLKVQVLAAADFKEPDASTAGDLVLGTMGHRMSATAKLIVKADAAPAAGDIVIAAVNVEG